jgi:hypothetical protein
MCSKAIRPLLETKKRLIYVNANGTVALYSPAIIESQCTIDVRKFPFDTQTCDLPFVSWIYDPVDLNLVPGGAMNNIDVSILHILSILEYF